MYPHEDLYTNFHSSFIYNSRQLETTQTFQQLNDKLILVHPYNAKILSNKKEQKKSWAQQ